MKRLSHPGALIGAAILATLIATTALAVATATASHTSDINNPKSEIRNPISGSPWQRYKLTGSSLNSVDALAQDNAWAVGTDGLVTHWDGSHWNVIDVSKLIGAAPVQSVDAFTPTDVRLGTTNGRILHYNGSLWLIDASAITNATIYDISMITPIEGWAAGSSGTFGHWGGKGWNQVVPGGTLTTTMYGIDAVSETDVWAVGGASDGSGTTARIAHYNGTNWQEVPNPLTSRILYDVQMLDANYGWAVGSGGALLQWNGTTWTQFTAPASAVSLKSVTVLSQTDAWAVGSTNISTGNLWHWNGTAWAAVGTIPGGPINSIFMRTASDGWAVGARGVVSHWDGNTWTNVNSHWTINGFYALDFVSPTDGWAVGVLNADPPAYGLVHWDGTTWTPNQPPSFSPTAYDVDMVSSNAVWVVGTSGYVFKYNGTNWTRDTSPSDAHLYAMSMLSATDGWAVGGSGRIVHYDGTAWINYTSNTSTNLWSIDMASANEGWAGGTSGLMLHYQNGTWTPITPNPSTRTIEGIDMLNENEGWAVGYNGTILHYQGGSWTIQTSPTTNNLLNVHMLNPNEGWAVGAAATGATATILHYQDGTWTNVPSPTGIDLRDIYMFDATHGWAVGQAPGPILHLDGLAGGTPTPAASTTPTSQPTLTGTTIATTTSVPTLTATPTWTPGSTETIRVLTPTHTQTPAGTATPCPMTFSDVHPTDYFYEAVRYLYCRGVISGYSDNTFRPFNNTTRGQLTKIVVLAEGWALNCTSQHFSDVPPSHTFYCYIETAVAHGTISGYADGTFKPGNDVTRGQLAKIVVLAEGWADSCATQHFSDVPPSHPFFCNIETAFAHGIISGYADGTFRPGNPATRGQISKIVYGAVTQP